MNQLHDLFVHYGNFMPNRQLKPKNENSVMYYSLSSCSKPYFVLLNTKEDTLKNAGIQKSGELSFNWIITHLQFEHCNSEQTNS